MNTLIWILDSLRRELAMIYLYFSFILNIFCNKVSLQHTSFHVLIHSSHHVPCVALSFEYGEGNKIYRLLLWVSVLVWWRRQTSKERQAPRWLQMVGVVKRVRPTDMLKSDVQTGSVMVREVLPENLTLTWNVNEGRGKYVKINGKIFPGRGKSKS